MALTGFVGRGTICSDLLDVLVRQCPSPFVGVDNEDQKAGKRGADEKRGTETADNKVVHGEAIMISPAI